MFRVFQVEALDQLLGARPPRALGQDGDLRMKIVPRLKVGLWISLLIHPFVIGAHARDPVLVEQQLAAGKTGKDGDPSLFHLGRQPLNELVNGDNVVAMVAQGWGHDGELVLALLRQEVNRLFGDLSINRGFGLKTGQQLAHGAGVQQRS